MKKTLILVMILLVLGLNISYASDDEECGSFYTSDGTGVDKETYHISENVYITATGFVDDDDDDIVSGLDDDDDNDDNCVYTVKRNGLIVASGDLLPDSSGNINQALIYTTVAEDFDQNMKAYLKCDDCPKKKDRFYVDEFVVPEFNAFTLALAAIGAVGTVLLVRRKFS